MFTRTPCGGVLRAQRLTKQTLKKKADAFKYITGIIKSPMLPVPARTLS